MYSRESVLNRDLLGDVEPVSTPKIDSKYLDKKSPLSRLLSEAAYLPYCSHDKTAKQFKPKEYAIKYPYMQVNRPGFVSWLVFDLDHTNSFVWDDELLPEPNMIVSNRENGHSHLFYAITPVCTTENARSHPIAYMKAIVDAMKLRLRADLSYSGPVAKTPGHNWWHTAILHNAVFSLGDLAKHLELENKHQWSDGPNLEANSHSRHMLLFEQTRFYAYSIVEREKEFGAYQGFTQKIHSYAMSKNIFSVQGFSHNLTFNQVKATVKSISRWTWDRYTGTGRCNAGVMQLDKSLSLQERQKQSAARTHSIIKKASESRIQAACRLLIQKGVKLTQTAIAAASGLSRQTIAKYQHIITSLNETTNIFKLRDIQSALKNVKSGTHKITAPLRGVVECLETIPEQLEIEDLGRVERSINELLEPP